MNQLIGEYGCSECKYKYDPLDLYFMDQVIGEYGVSECKYKKYDLEEIVIEVQIDIFRSLGPQDVPKEFS